MRLLYRLEKIQLIPIAIGISIACLMFSDFYLVKVLASFFGSTKPFKIFPYEVSLCISIAIFIVCILVTKINTLNTVIIQNQEKVFILLLLIGFQTVGVIPGPLDTSDIVFGIITILWLVNVITSERYDIHGSPLNFLNLTLLFFAVFSVINGGLPAIFAMTVLIKAVVTSFFIIDILRRKEWIVYFIKALFVITTISAIIAIIQEIVFYTTGFILAMYDAKFIKLILEQTPFGTFLRVPAFTSMHMFLANFLVTSLLIGFNYFLYSYDTINPREKRLVIIAMSLTAVALILTFSKTSMVGFTFGIMISVFIKWHTRSIHFLMLILLLGPIIYLTGLSDTIYEKFWNQLELMGDLGNRVELLRRGIEGCIHKHPFIGAGIGMGKKYTQDIYGWGVHNAFVRAADDIGIFGLFVFIGLFIYSYARIIAALTIVEEPKDRAFLTTLIAGLTAYLINIQFQPDFLSYYNWVFVAFIESSVIVLSNESKKLNNKAMSSFEDSIFIRNM